MLLGCLCLYMPCVQSSVDVSTWATAQLEVLGAGQSCLADAGFIMCSQRRQSAPWGGLRWCGMVNQNHALAFTGLCVLARRRSVDWCAREHTAM